MCTTTSEEEGVEVNARWRSPEERMPTCRKENRDLAPALLLGAAAAATVLTVRTSIPARTPYILRLLCVEEEEEDSPSPC